MQTTSRPDSAGYQDFQDQPWVSGIFRPLLIVLLATSVAPVAVTVLHRLTPWRLGYVLPLAFVVAAEGVYSTLERGRPQWRDRRGLLLRLSELALLALVLRLCTWFFSTSLPGMREATLWLSHPSAFFDGQFLTIGVLLLLIWGLAIAVTADFTELAIQADEYSAHEATGWDDSSSRQRIYRAKSRTETVGQFAWLWGCGGVVLALCAAMSRATISLGGNGAPIFGLSRANLPTAVLIALLCYFLCGLLLMSEGRLAVLRGHWYNQGIAVMPGVLQRWHLSSIAIVLLVAMLAAILPLASTGGLAQVLEVVLGALFRAGYFVVAALFFLMSVILYPLRFLFANQQGQEASPPPRFDMPEQAQAATSHVPAWLGGAIYWVLIALVLGYLLFSYLNAHGLLRGLQSGTWLRLRFWWRARWSRLSQRAAAATAALRKRLVLRRPARSGPRPAAVRLGDLAPAARIRYFYLATLARAAERGLARKPHETPLEFGRDLTGQWPDAEVDFQALTEAFLAARYDRRDIPAEKAQDVQSVWRRVMNSLRRSKDESEARD
jgi:hypothetical protein